MGKELSKIVILTSTGEEGIKVIQETSKSRVVDPFLQLTFPQVFEFSETSFNGFGLFSGVVAIGNVIYAVGGYDGREQLNSVERYNVQDDTWTAVARMKHRRSALSVAVHNGMIYALGKNASRLSVRNQR